MDFDLNSSIGKMKSRFDSIIFGVLAFTACLGWSKYVQIYR